MKKSLNQNLEAVHSYPTLLADYNAYTLWNLKCYMHI